MPVLVPPVEPMLAKLARDLPAPGGREVVFEPKWDGFRCLAFVSAGAVDLRSRNDRPLARYFPEVVAELAARTADAVLDGELVACRDGQPDFPALLARLHPAATRVQRLAAETPASFLAFDLLATDGEDLRDRPFGERRRRLERLVGDGRDRPVQLSPTTSIAIGRRSGCTPGPGPASTA
jgi:ATP-dependent DNA ligase